MLIKSMPLVNWSKGLYHVVETQSRCYAHMPRYCDKCQSSQFVLKKTQMDDGTDGQEFGERVGML